MSETLEVPVLTVGRASLADIGESPWLVARIAEHWVTTPGHAMGWLRSSLDINDQALVRCGPAFGMAHVEYGRMGSPNRVVIDFVIAKGKDEDTDAMVAVFGWFETWAKRLGCSGLFRVDDFTDCDRSWIVHRLGRLSVRQMRHAIFV